MRSPWTEDVEGNGLILLLKEMGPSSFCLFDEMSRFYVMMNKSM